MKGSGRDDLHFLGDNIASWAELARDAGEGTYFCESLEDHLRITTLPAPEGSGRWGIGAAAGGGLVSRFDAADELCENLISVLEIEINNFGKNSKIN